MYYLALKLLQFLLSCLDHPGIPSDKFLCWKLCSNVALFRKMRLYESDVHMLALAGFSVNEVVTSRVRV